MFKSTDTRLADTKTFIGTVPGADLGMRTRAVGLVDQYLNANPAQKNDISNALHIGEIGPDPQGNRNARRAYVLLHKAIAATCGTALGTGLPPASVAIAPALARLNLQTLIKWASILRDQTTMDPYTMNVMLTELRQNPLLFLQNNPVIVLGSSHRDPGQGDRNVLPFHFSFSPTSPFRRFQFAAAASSGSAPAMVDSVTARWWTDIPGSYVQGGNPALGDFSQLEGIQLGSPIMVTTQFTGCAFAMKRSNGHVYCAHTTPRPPITGFADVVRPMTGTQLAQEIHSLNGVAGDFTNAAGGHPLAIYGAAWSTGILNGASYPNGLGGGVGYMTILGIQRGADYEIYSQVTQNKTITSAQRIF